MPERHSPMQPKAGEIVLHCEHARETEEPRRTFKIGTHWLSTTIAFWIGEQRGAPALARWLNCCEACYRALGGDLARISEIEIGGHVVWDGNAPVIVEVRGDA